MVDYIPWPTTGCTLAQARERTAERPVWDHRSELLRKLEPDASDIAPAEVDAELQVIEAEISAICLDHLTSRRLIAYGSPGPKQIDKNEWRLLTAVDWEKSSAAKQRAGGSRVRDVRVYPTLLAPCRVDILDGLPLIEAFRDYVLRDPEVAQLAREAVRRAPEFANMFLEGRRGAFGDGWPLEFESPMMKTTVHPDPKKRWKFGPHRSPDPIEAVIAEQAYINRYSRLVALLRTGEIEASGIPGTAGAVEQIPRAIWSHRDFYFEPSTGDILQDNPRSTGRYDRYLKRWVGVMLQKGSNRQSSITAQPAPGAPFTVIEVIALRSLAEALSRLVFRHPYVRSLCGAAKAVADVTRGIFDEYAGLVGLVYGHDEPLLPLRYFERIPGGSDELLPSADEIAPWDGYLDNAEQTEIRAYYDEVDLRARMLIEMLQRQEIVARGHVVDGHLVEIAHTIWSHENYYVHPPTGDVWEAVDDHMVKKWTGVVVEAPAIARAGAMFHGKHTEDDGARSTPKLAHVSASPLHRKTAVEASIEKAVAALWPDGIPPMQLKVRDKIIADWQRRKKLPVASSKTIRRYLTHDGKFHC